MRCSQCAAPSVQLGKSRAGFRIASRRLATCNPQLILVSTGLSELIQKVSLLRNGRLSVSSFFFLVSKSRFEFRLSYSYLVQSKFILLNSTSTRTESLQAYWHELSTVSTFRLTVAPGCIRISGPVLRVLLVCSSSG